MIGNLLKGMSFIFNSIKYTPLQSKCNASLFVVRCLSRKQTSFQLSNMVWDAITTKHDRESFVIRFVTNTSGMMTIVTGRKNSIVYALTFRIVLLYTAACVLLLFISSHINIIMGLIGRFETWIIEVPLWQLKPQWINILYVTQCR